MYFMASGKDPLCELDEGFDKILENLKTFLRTHIEDTCQVKQKKGLVNQAPLV